ncbi:MAG: MATE family efflux transporter [Oscillospiraceae bacterium]
MKQNKQELLLNEPNLYKSFTILATPVFLSNFLKSFHDVVDTFFIGQIPNSVAAQAAISISWPLLAIFTSLSIGFSVAGVSIISQNLGADKNEDAKKYSGLLFTMALMLGAIINVFLYASAPFVMKMMGAEGDVLACAITYIRVRSFEMLFLMIFTAYQSMRQASGDMSSPVYLSSMAVILNIFLTWLMVNVLNMGIFGAAFSTLISQIIITPFALYLSFHPNCSLYVSLSDLKIDIPKIKLLFNVAMPAALGQAISSLGFLVLNALILDYGPVVVAAFSNGNKISNMLLMPVGALGTVQAAYIGQNIGANNKERAMAAYKTGRNLGLIISVIGCLILYPFREASAALLSNSGEVIAVTVEYMIWVILLQPLMAMFQNYMGTFNGAGMTKYTMIFSLARLWLLRLPLILFFKNFTDFGRSGIWYSMVLSNLIILILGHYFLKKMTFSKLADK